MPDSRWFVRLDKTDGMVVLLVVPESPKDMPIEGRCWTEITDGETRTVLEADSAQYTVKDGRLIFRPIAEYEAIRSMRDRGTPLEQRVNTLKAEVETLKKSVAALAVVAKT